MKTQTISIARLHEVLDYDPNTGLLTWKVARRGKAKKGSVAGCKDPSNGYIRVAVDGVSLKAHRVAIAIMTGEWPEEGLHTDHINGKRDDNRWDNLRVVTRSENLRNTPARPGKTLQVKGVYRSGNGYQAKIRLDGMLIHLARSEHPEIAAAIYDQAAIARDGEYARINEDGVIY